MIDISPIPVLPFRASRPAQDIIISALPQGGTGAPDEQGAFGPTVFNPEVKFSLRLLQRAVVL